LRSLRESQPLSLLMIDVDFFKEYNDTCGHLQGDHVLRTVAQAITASQGSDRDLLARYGGDEFALVLPDTDPVGAEAVAARITATLAELSIPHPESRIADVVTVSIGGSTHLPDEADAVTAGSRGALIGPDDLLLAADSALYDAKQAGRGRACFRPMASVAVESDGSIPTAGG
jgi:diguanylate cyclase (GGDEF)-like protein